MTIVIWVDRDSNVIGMDTLEGWEETNKTMPGYLSEVWMGQVNNEQELFVALNTATDYAVCSNAKFDAEMYEKEMKRYL